MHVTPQLTASPRRPRASSADMRDYREALFAVVSRDVRPWLAVACTTFLHWLSNSEGRPLYSRFHHNSQSHLAIQRSHR